MRAEGNDEITMLIYRVKCRFICVPFQAPHPALVCPAPRPLGVAAYYSEENMLLKARQKKEGWKSPFADRFPQGNPFFVSVNLSVILFRYLCAKFSTRVCEFVS